MPKSLQCGAPPPLCCWDWTTYPVGPVGDVEQPHTPDLSAPIWKISPSFVVAAAGLLGMEELGWGRPGCVEQHDGSQYLLMTYVNPGEASGCR